MASSSAPVLTTLAPPAPVIQAKPRTPRQLGLPRLSVVIVNYRQWEQTAELVRQLLTANCIRRGDAEIVIIDNHSPAHPLAKKLRRMPQVSLRRWNRNHGFAAAVNEGCRLSQGDWFLLLNPDTTLSEGFLDNALALADQLAMTDPRAGIVGFHLRDSDGAQQLSSGPYPTLLSTLARLALPRRRRKYKAVRGAERQPVPWVTGCCLLLRRACLQDLGGLDEEFFLYYEDVDLCLRARQHGWTVWYDPSHAVVHHNPLHNRPVPAALRLVTRHSLLTYGQKHWPHWQFRLLANIIRVEAWARRAGARWRGDGQQAASYRQLSALVRALQSGDEGVARQRLEQAIQRLDLRVGV